jgi:antibiotic biosynthesis monooxygenase (ABM) superfamily enzyme
MFLVAPIISTGLLIYLLLPGTKRMLAEWQND